MGSVLWVGITYLNHQPSIENPDHADFLSRKKKEEAISGHWGYNTFDKAKYYNQGTTIPFVLSPLQVVFDAGQVNFF